MEIGQTVLHRATSSVESGQAMLQGHEYTIAAVAAAVSGSEISSSDMMA